MLNPALEMKNLKIGFSDRRPKTQDHPSRPRVNDELQERTLYTIKVNSRQMKLSDVRMMKIFRDTLWWTNSLSVQLYNKTLPTPKSNKGLKICNATRQSIGWWI